MQQQPSTIDRQCGREYEYGFGKFQQETPRASAKEVGVYAVISPPEVIFGPFLAVFKPKYGQYDPIFNKLQLVMVY